MFSPGQTSSQACLVKEHCYYWHLLSLSLPWLPILRGTHFLLMVPRSLQMLQAAPWLILVQ